MSILRRVEKREEFEPEQRKRKKLAMPDVYVILFCFLLLAYISSFIIPSGAFERVEKDGMTQVVPDSFQLIDADPLSMMDVFSSIQRGLTEASAIIFVILIVGGVIRVIEYTGSIEAGIHALIQRSRGNQNLLIVTFCTIFAVAFSMGMAPNLTVAFVPIGILFARKLNLDPVIGLAIVFLGAYSGFVGGVFDPVVTVMGQTLAGVPVFSGAWFRGLIFIVFVFVTAVYIIMYAKKDRTNSSNSRLRSESIDENVGEEKLAEIQGFHAVHKLILIFFFGAIGLFIFGSMTYGWAINELSAIFLMLGIGVALVFRMTPNQFVKVFMEGAGRMMYGALIIGVAGAVVIILQDAQVLDTIVHSVSSWLSHFTPVLSMVILYVFNFLFNGIVSSGTGQAAIVMPIMVPIGDMLNVTRQSIFITFKLGDAVTNIITPLSGTLMSCLAIGKVSYVRWAKFVFPLLLIWMVLGGIFVAAAVLINYGPL